MLLTSIFHFYNVYSPSDVTTYIYIGSETQHIVLILLPLNIHKSIQSKKGRKETIMKV